MPAFDNPPTHEEMQTLREDIKKKYQTYHRLDRDRFPEFEYNTSRANYEPLRESFNEEFYRIRGLLPSDKSIHIPSTNTLAQLFCDEHYLPGKKILHTCRAYVDESPGDTGISDSPINNLKTPSLSAKLVTLICIGVVLVVALGIYAIRETSLKSTPPASGLTLNRPSNGRVVPQEVLAGGTVLNAKIVWVVVRPAGSKQYFVQPPMTVGDDHTWRGVTYIGSVNRANIGSTFQIRAFVNPVAALKEGDLLNSWPQAELATGIVNVVRGAQTE